MAHFSKEGRFASKTQHDLAAGYRQRGEQALDADTCTMWVAAQKDLGEVGARQELDDRIATDWMKERRCSRHDATLSAHIKRGLTRTDYETKVRLDARLS